MPCELELLDAWIDWSRIVNIPILDYWYKPGLSGGQIGYGGSAAGEHARLRSTAHATKGTVYLGDDGGVVQAGGVAGSSFVVQTDKELLNISNAGFIFNETGEDVDFRVEGDTVVNLFFIDASMDRVGIGTATPSKPFDVALLGGIRISRTESSSSSNELYFQDNGQIRSADDNHRIMFLRSSNQLVLREYGDIIFDYDVQNTRNTTNFVQFRQGVSLDIMTIYANGAIVINETGDANADVRIEGDTDINLFFTDASVNRVGFRTNTPLAVIDILGGYNAAGTANGDGPIAIQWGGSGGGYRHWIKTRHNATLTSGNAFEFYCNNNGTAGGSSAPGTGNICALTIDHVSGSPRVGINTGANTTPGAMMVVSGGDLRVGTVTDTATSGDFAAGLVTAARIFYDQSAQTMYWYRSTDVQRAYLDANLAKFVLGAVETAAFATAEIQLRGDSGSANIDLAKISFARSLYDPTQTAAEIIFARGGSGTEGRLRFLTRAGGGSLLERFMLYDNTTGVVFNEPGENYDFRVEGDAQSNLFFIDASTDRVGLRTATPAEVLGIRCDTNINTTVLPCLGCFWIYSGTSSITTNPAIISVHGQWTVDTGITISGTQIPINFDVRRDVAGDLGSIAGVWGIVLYHGHDSTLGATAVTGSLTGINLRFYHAAGTISTYRGLSLNVAATGGTVTTSIGIELSPPIGATSTTAILVQRGASIFNELGEDYDFRVEGDADGNLFFVDASTDRVGIGTSAPLNKLHVNSSIAVNTNAIHGFRVDHAMQVTSGGSYSSTGIVSDIRNLRVDAGITNSGAYNGAQIVANRNHASDGGTLSTQRGIWINWGQSSAVPGTAVTSNATGITLSGEVGAGTIGTMTGISISSTTGGTLTNFIGIDITAPTTVTLQIAIRTNAGGSIFNENGGDFDFRVEGDNDVNCFFVDASTDIVCIGTNAGIGVSEKLYVREGILVRRNGTAFIRIENDSAVGGQVRANTAAGGGLIFTDQLSTTEFFRLGSAACVVNENGDDRDFRIESDTDANLFVIDAGTSRVGIGTLSPQVKLDIEGAIATRETTPSQITADQDNYDVGSYTFLRLYTDAARTITGFTPGTTGRWLIIRNIGSYDITITDQDGSSFSTNQVITTTGGSVVIAPGQLAIFIYDQSAGKWVMW